MILFNAALNKVLILKVDKRQHNAAYYGCIVDKNVYNEYQQIKQPKQNNGKQVSRKRKPYKSYAKSFFCVQNIYFKLNNPRVKKR